MWWLSTYQNTDVIPLSQVVSLVGGPSIDTHFNLYYIEWWSLAHFLFHYDNDHYRTGVFDLLANGSSLSQFEAIIGDIDTIHNEWYGYFNDM